MLHGGDGPLWRDAREVGGPEQPAHSPVESEPASSVAVRSRSAGTAQRRASSIQAVSMAGRGTPRGSSSWPARAARRRSEGG
jgi:hypothetical protein